MRAQPFHDLAHLNITGNCRCFQIVAIIGIGAFNPCFETGIGDRFKFGSCFGEGGHAGIDRNISMIDTAKFFRTGMNMDELLLWHRNIDQLIALRGHFTKACAYDQQKIRIFDAGCEFRADRCSHFTGIKRVGIVEHILTTEGCGNRQRHVFRECLQVANRLRIPAAATDDHQWSFGLFEQRFHVL